MVRLSSVSLITINDSKGIGPGGGFHLDGSLKRGCEPIFFFKIRMSAAGSNMALAVGPVGIGTALETVGEFILWKK